MLRVKRLATTSRSTSQKSREKVADSFTVLKSGEKVILFIRVLDLFLVVLKKIFAAFFFVVWQCKLIIDIDLTGHMAWHVSVYNSSIDVAGLLCVCVLNINGHSLVDLLVSRVERRWTGLKSRD